MGVVVGLILGLGATLVWSSFWERPQRAPSNRETTFHHDLHAAGFTGVSVNMFVLASVLLGIVGAAIALLISRLPVAALVAGVASGLSLLIVVYTRATSTRRRRRAEWPQVVEHLISGIRAGLSLPEAVLQVAHRGPIELRPDFQEFARDYHASGQFDTSLLSMKNRLADPVADRVIEALRLARSVGGSELGVLLEALNQFLRQDLRTRGELEARQSWTVGGARVAVAAPWVILLMLSTRPEASQAYASSTGTLLILIGAAVTVFAYWLMLRLGALPTEKRVLA
ncbi:type II secretion system F family protein [Populibacterium corticicola]|jgi:tight adherence protein B|uniref:Type II secretion system F family protein n=1 Tax=Populibacterium corticicola TaxID=1812826 RepID=A0ABW5XI60_9MICO